MGTGVTPPPVGLCGWVVTPPCGLFQEWGCEGYHLWMVSDKPKEALASSEHQHMLPRLLQLQFVKAAVSVNPCVVSLANVSLT